MRRNPRLRRHLNLIPWASFHVDIAEVRTEEGKLYLFVAMDRTSKFVYVELLDRYGKAEAVPYKIYTILTDNGIQFTNRKMDKHAFMHIFDRVCSENAIEHRLTKVNHPWTNGKVERMNKTLKEATVKRYHDDTSGKLKQHLYDFLRAYNCAKHLKTLKGLTPYEAILKYWKSLSQKFRLNPNHYCPGTYKAHVLW